VLKLTVDLTGWAVCTEGNCFFFPTAFGRGRVGAGAIGKGADFASRNMA